MQANTGPVVSRSYRYRLHLVADALVSVGAGVSYAAAADRARAAAGRRAVTGDGTGTLVAEWVDAWAPTVLDALLPRPVLDTLVLDSTDFRWTDPRTGLTSREFAVLVAYGYTSTGTKMPLGALATTTTGTNDYCDLLQHLRLPAPPKSVVADADPAIAAAVTRYWPATTPFLFRCEHHLRARALRALALDNAAAPKGRWGRVLDTAFRREEGWAEFCQRCRPLTHTTTWIEANTAQISAQVKARPTLPPHYSNAGAESLAAALRDMYEHRSFALRNARRTNLLLGLACLHLNNLDDAGHYHRLIRATAEKNRGAAPQPQRLGRQGQTPPNDVTVATLH
ncbi:MAG: hypothetical protein ABF811_01360 [Pseudoclavibacter sp.]